MQRTLHARTFEGRSPEILALHGFTGTGQDFEALHTHLPLAMACPDLPGHGQSTAIRVEHLSEAAALLPTGLGLVLGYSMGGRLALQLAVDASDRVDALVLIGATAGLTDAAERQGEDEARAQQIEQDLPAFVQDWEKHPVLVGQHNIAEPFGSRLRARRYVQDPAGLAAALRTMGTGAMTPLWDDLTTIAAPTLLITGANDAKFTAIAERMAAELPDATCFVVPEAGHTAHLEQPRMVAEALTGWLMARGLA